jgi:phosphoadenosine phosphosulfate reductase
MIPTVPLDSQRLASALAAELPGRDLFERLALTAARIPGRIVLTTSFGIEDQVLTHAVFTQNLPVEVVTFDTGRLFPETHQVWADTEARYGRRIRGLSPDRRRLEALVARQGIDGFRASIEARRACCDVRKVGPLGRALDGAAGWITGLRAEQSADRALADFVVADPAYGVLKVSPLFDWTRDRVVDFVHRHKVPYNVLHDRGFVSIGCAPCTRAVKPGEPERAGRWWWEQNDKKECGLHRHPANPPPNLVPATALEKV